MTLRTTFLALLLLCAFSGFAVAAAPQVNVGLNDVIAAIEKSFQPDSTGAIPIHDFSADFFQRTVLAKEGRELRGDGRISVRMPIGTYPLMFRFEYFRPTPQEIVSDGRAMWIYHPENREVILSDVSFLYNRLSFDPGRNRAFNFLQGLGSLSRDFQINFAPGMHDAAANYVLELTPRRSMLNTRRILLVVSRETALAQAGARTAPRAAAALPQPPQLLPAPRPGSPAPKTAFSTAPSFGQNYPPPQFGSQSDPFPILSSTIEDHQGNTTTIEFANIRTNRRLPQSQFLFTVPGGVQIIRPSEQNLPR